MAKTKSQVNVVEHAEKILADLQTKRAAIAEARAADESEMADIAYQAHTGDEKAAAALVDIRERALRRDHEIRSLEAAIAKAGERLKQAQAAEARAANRKLAEEAREIADRIDALFTSADKHLALAFDALKAADGRIEELHRLGFTFPTAIQVRTNALFALQSYLMALPKYWWTELNHSGVRFLAPGERRTFAQFWARMVEPIARHIGARLNETKTEKEVA